MQYVEMTPRGGPVPQGRPMADTASVCSDRAGGPTGGGVGGGSQNFCMEKEAYFRGKETGSGSAWSRRFSAEGAGELDLRLPS